MKELTYTTESLRSISRKLKESGIEVRLFAILNGLKKYCILKS
jgi:hypothetical protein